MVCPVCGGPLVADPQRGETACAQCGFVVAEAAVDTGPEWRVFGEGEKRRVRTAPLKLVVKTDMGVKPEHSVEWRRLAGLHRKALHGWERRLAAIGGELRRVKECVGLPQSVVEEAEALVKKYFETVAGFPPDAVAVAVLWTAARAAGAPRPLADFLGCSKSDERQVKKAVWRLSEVVRLRRRPIEDYVKTLAARVNLPAAVVKAAVELLERNRRVLAGKNPWVWAAAAVWLAATSEGLSLFLSIVAEAAGATPGGVENAARRLRT
jgi:transcription initiation factor TFIIB